MTKAKRKARESRKEISIKISIATAREIARRYFINKFGNEYKDVPLVKHRMILDATMRDDEFVHFRLKDFLEEKK